ncbi:MAG: copper ABC transporter permease [Lachnospiraceae bacterium]|nr:MAG: copper ABC transporter permease [Lachnospiraceae bacterium]
MKAIFKREFLSFFRGITGWLFLGLNLVVYGLYFTVYNLMQGIPSIAYAINGMSFIFLITVPILTMRVFAAERRDKTDQLTMTSPVGVGGIVLGKFLALACCFAIVVAFIAASPFILRIYGTVSLKESFTSVLGLLLYGLTLLAVGLFASALTPNVIVSAVVSFGLIFLGYISSSLVSALSLSGVPAKILGWYDFTTPLSDFLSGSLSLKNIVYFLTVIVLCLVLATQIILKRRYTISKKRLTVSAFSLVTIIAVIAAAIVGNFAMTKVPDKYAVHDMTKRKYYTLSDKTKNILSKLDKDVTIYCLAKKSSLTYDYEVTLKKTLDNYAADSDYVTVKYVDTTKNPTFASKYTDSELSSGSLIVVSGNRSRTIDTSDLYETQVDSSTYSQQVTGYDIEGQVTSAINYLNAKNLEKIYLLSGHDEMSLSSTFTKTLTKLNAQTATLNFLKADSVPEDAAAVIIFGAQSDLSKNDVEKLDNYVSGGGKVFVALDVIKNSGLKNLNRFLTDNGIKATSGIVAETNENYYTQNQYYLLPKVNSTKASADVSGTLQVFMPFSVGLTKTNASGINYLNLAVTSDKAIAKNSLSDSNALQKAVSDTGTVKKEDGDAQGQFSLGLISINKKKGEVVAFGSAYTFSDEENQMVSGKNATLFSNVFSYLLPDDSKNSVSIPVKSIDSTTLTINASGIKIFGFLTGLILPLALIVCGIVVCIVRRKR